MAARAAALLPLSAAAAAAAGGAPDGLYGWRNDGVLGEFDLWRYALPTGNATKVGTLTGEVLSEGAGDIDSARGVFALLTSNSRTTAHPDPSYVGHYRAVAVNLADASIVANVSLPTLQYVNGWNGFAQRALVDPATGNLAVVGPVSNATGCPRGQYPCPTEHFDFVAIDTPLRGGAPRTVTRFEGSPQAEGGLAAFAGGRFWSMIGNPVYSSAAHLIGVDMAAGKVAVNTTLQAPPGLVVLEADAATGKLYGIGSRCTAGLPTRPPTPAPPPPPPLNCSASPAGGAPCGTPGDVNATACAESACCWDEYNNYCWGNLPPPAPPQAPMNFCLLSVDPHTGAQTEKGQIAGDWRAVQPGLSAYDPKEQRLYFVGLKDFMKTHERGDFLVWVDVATGETGSSPSAWCGGGKGAEALPHCPTIMRFHRAA